MKKCILGILIIFLLTASANATTPSAIEGDQSLTLSDISENYHIFFREPQDAIAYFANCIAQTDFENALHVSAAKSLSENLNYEQYLDLYNNNLLYTGFPTGYESYIVPNWIMWSSRFSAQVFQFASGILFGPEYIDNTYETILLNEADFIVIGQKSVPLREFVQELDPNRLKNLILVNMFRLDETYYDYEKVYTKEADTYSYLEQANYLVVYEFEGEFYAQTYVVVRYELGWQIMSLNSTIIISELMNRFQNPSGGMPSHISYDDYLWLLSNSKYISEIGSIEQYSNIFNDILYEYPNKFFSSPADVAQWFATCLQEGNFEELIRISSSNSIAHNFDLEKHIQRIRFLDLTQKLDYLNAPGIYEQYIPLTNSYYIGNYMRSINQLIGSILLEPELFDGEYHSLSEDDIIELEANYNPLRLSGLNLKAIFMCNHEMYFSEQNQRNIAREGAIYGYSDRRDLLIIWEFEGNIYQSSCIVTEYEKGWQLYLLSSPWYSSDARAQMVTLEELSDIYMNPDNILLFEQN